MKKDWCCYGVVADMTSDKKKNAQIRGICKNIRSNSAAKQTLVDFYLSGQLQQAIQCPVVK